MKQLNVMLVPGSAAACFCMHAVSATVFADAAVSIIGAIVSFQLSSMLDIIA